MSLKTILKNFLNHVDTLESQRKLGKDLYETDFQKLKALTEELKHDKDYACTEGLKDVNRRKNRYKDILPYDCTRVILSDYPGVPGSDYINANYIKGASGSLAYIASQGPLPNTVVDFWRMIWECEVQVIVMACNEQESGKYKCECYWPNEDEKKQYGNINVELVKWRQVCPDFLVRTLKACWENEERVLCQFHYTTWPDHGVPNSVQPILELVRLIRDCQTSEAVPVLIHCSAGCGRTGTICAIDYVWGLMRMGKLTKSFNLFNVIADMRRQRIAMVQTKEQYVLVHKAVSSLFEQQLRVIDSHTYENLDEDGEPLILRELQPEDVVYEDIMEPESFPKTFKTGDCEVLTLKLHDGGISKEHSPAKIKMESHAFAPTSGSSITIPAVAKQSISSSSITASHVMTSSAVSQNDYQVTAIAQQILCEPEQADESLSPGSRNSAVLHKLCREESVKRLISGWNKAAQQLECPDSSVGFTYIPKTPKAANELHRTKSDNESLKAKHQVDCKSQSRQADNLLSNDSSIQDDHVRSKHRSSDADSKEHSCTVSDNSQERTSMEQDVPESVSSSATSFSSSDRSLIDESQHAGKLVGKATVIRRPSIAKLKALFEKTATSSSNLDSSSVESSRRRRPLFRSHSHYVGHSRTFSVPDACETQVEVSLTSASVGNVSNLHSRSVENTLVWNSSSPLEKEHEHVFVPVSKNADMRSSSPGEGNISTIMSKSHDAHSWKNSATLHHEGKGINSGNQQYSYSQTNNTHFDHLELSGSYRHGGAETRVQDDTDSHANRSCVVSESIIQEIGSVHKRVKQYSSSPDNPPILPVKRNSSKDASHSAKDESKRGGKSVLRPSESTFKESSSQTLVPSKSENYLNSVSHVMSFTEPVSLTKTDEARPKSLVPSDVQVSNHSARLENRKHHSGAAEVTGSGSKHAGEARKESSDPSSGSTRRATLLDTLYGHCIKQHTVSSKLQQEHATSQKETKYMNVNPLSQKNLQQIEEKLKAHPRGAIIDLTSGKSYTDEAQNLCEKPPVFVSSNQPVKLLQVMETSDLRPLDQSKERGATENFHQQTGVNLHTSSSKSTHSSSAKASSSGKSRSHHQDSLKNLLLHSPPPKSKRSHSSKHSSSSSSSCSNSLPSHGEKAKVADKKETSKSESKLVSDSVATTAAAATTTATTTTMTTVSSSSKNSADSSRTHTTTSSSSLHSSAPASRSDPRYFPVTRQTPEEAKYASEKQKASELRKTESHLYENAGYYGSHLADLKGNFLYQLHRKPGTDIRECYISRAALPKPYCAYSYKPSEQSAHGQVKSEDVYGVQRSSSGHHLYQILSGSSSTSNKDSSEKEGLYAHHIGNFAQRSQNAPSYVTSTQECVYGTARHNPPAPVQSVYPPGPPKPPRTYGHAYKHMVVESGDHAKQHSTDTAKHSNWEGGRYLVSVASPKHSTGRTEANSKPSGEYWQSSSAPWQPRYKSDYGTVRGDRLMSQSYPFPNCDPIVPKKVTENAHADAGACRTHTSSSDGEHIYHTIRELQRPPPNTEPSYVATRSRSKCPDYENMVDAQRDYLDAMKSPRWDARSSAYHQSTNATSKSGIQYSQSDASIYAVLQEPKPPENSSSAWQPSYDASVQDKPAANRVYFDTLQRKHKQHVSWEQRRSHDDMDIRPPPSSRLKEQIHARRSMVELDNLEISVAAENGFQEKNSSRGSARNEFYQDGVNAAARMDASALKRPPAELSDSLINKDSQGKKGHVQSKDGGSFGGTLYKAFGKLTSFTKFSAKESTQRPSPENSVPSTKGPPPPAEEKAESSFNQWSPQKAKEHLEPSEQWTEV